MGVVAPGEKKLIYYIEI